MPGRVNIPIFSPYLHRFRKLVERFINKLKHVRAIATRFEKQDANYLPLVKRAAAKIWMRFMTGGPSVPSTLLCPPACPESGSWAMHGVRAWGRSRHQNGYSCEWSGRSCRFPAAAWIGPPNMGLVGRRGSFGLGKVSISRTTRPKLQVGTAPWAKRRIRRRSE